MTIRLRVFQCVPLRAKLTRASCAALYRRANEERKKNPRRGNEAMRESAEREATKKSCQRCAIGATHAAGREHVDAPDVEVTA